jgi:hypothetical protein
VFTEEAYCRWTSPFAEAQRFLSLPLDIRAVGRPEPTQCSFGRSDGAANFGNKLSSEVATVFAKTSTQLSHLAKNTDQRQRKEFGLMPADCLLTRSKWAPTYPHGVLPGSEVRLDDAVSINKGLARPVVDVHGVSRMGDEQLEQRVRLGQLAPDGDAVGLHRSRPCGLKPSRKT